MNYFTALILSLALLVPSVSLADPVVVPPPVNTIIPGQTNPYVPPQQTPAPQNQPVPVQPQLGVSCAAMTYPLGPGSRGVAVSQLQTFLNATGFMQHAPSGYYGALTTAAVQQFQMKNGIASSGTPSTTGFGRVGPRTLSVIASQCGSGGMTTGGASGIVSGFIQVTPVNGTAPLSVKVVVTVNVTGACDAQTYAVDFGDGNAPQSLNVPAGTCQAESTTLAHTYLQSGTYTITLSSGDHSSTATVVAQ